MTGSSASNPDPWGAFSSSTMIVMMMAMTPSLKASSRPVPMGRLVFVLLCSEIREQGHQALRMFSTPGHRQIRDVLAVHDERRDRGNPITLHQLIGPLHRRLDVKPVILFYEVSV